MQGQSPLLALALLLAGAAAAVAPPLRINVISPAPGTHARPDKIFVDVVVYTPQGARDAVLLACCSPHLSPPLPSDDFPRQHCVLLNFNHYRTGLCTREWAAHGDGAWRLRTILDVVQEQRMIFPHPAVSAVENAQNGFVVEEEVGLQDPLRSYLGIVRLDVANSDNNVVARSPDIAVWLHPSLGEENIEEHASYAQRGVHG